MAIEIKLFQKRDAYLPYEYLSLLKYRDAIRQSYWLHTEYDYTADVHHYRTVLDEPSRVLVQRSLLAISQIELQVKLFWSRLYERMPKSEIAEVGVTFAESEVRHANAYAHLLELLGLSHLFETLLETPVFADRYNLLRRVSASAFDASPQEFLKGLVMFSALTEHIALFTQFLTLMAFNKRESVLKGISNAVEATSKEEQIHAMFGAELVRLLRQEAPSLWTDELVADLLGLAQEAYVMERNVVNWLFEGGDTNVIKCDEVNAFLQRRFNESLVLFGLPKLFEHEIRAFDSHDWFDVELLATKEIDFFYKRSVGYTKRSRAFSADLLF